MSPPFRCLRSCLFLSLIQKFLEESCTDFIRLRVGRGRRVTKLIWDQLFMRFSFLSIARSLFLSLAGLE